MTHLAMYSDATAWGGAEHALATLLGALPERFDVTIVGVDAAIVATIGAARPSAEQRVVRAVRGKSDLAGMRAHRRLVAELRPDVFHANLNAMSSCQYAILAALSVPGVRVIAHEHSPLADGSRLSLWLKRATSARLAAHVTVGDAAARTIEGLAGLPDHSIRTIHNAVAPHAPEATTPSWRRPAVGSIGRIEPLKGYDVLVEAAGGLDADVVLIGTGSAADIAELTALAASTGRTDRLHLAGWRPDARDLLAHLDVFVLPSRLEGLPLVVLEAMQAGLPVVATRVGSVEEVVDDGVTGIVVPVDDVPALHGAIASLLDDPDRQRRMGDAGRQRVQERFSVDTMAAAWTALYDEIVPVHAS